MKKILGYIAIVAVLITSCQNEGGQIALPTSTGSFNKVLVVTKSSHWIGEVGDALRGKLGELMVGLPQPESTLSLAQVAPEGFKKMMRQSRNVLVLEESDKENFTVNYDKYSRPQIVIYISAKDKAGLISMINKNSDKIIKLIKDSDIKLMQKVFAQKKVDDKQYKTISNLGLSITIPNEFRTVDDTGDFLWLRQHLKSGIARGAGSNNILVYSLPLDTEENIKNNISLNRDKIGEKYIPGSKEGMYMITEKAYTPFTYDAKIDNKKAFETRGKWEMKNNFMAGPFLNYTIIDKEHNRLIVFEGFTYCPSVEKREFIFELEAIGKSLKIL